MSVETENRTSQKGDGSPAQIWAELGLLASDIFGTIQMTREWAEIYVSLNETADSMQIGREITTPSAECEHRHTHAHTHAHIA